MINIKNSERGKGLEKKLLIQLTIYKKGSDKIMNMYQKRKVRQEKRENNNEEKNRQIAPISWDSATNRQLPENIDNIKF